ncbi:hypothetical protein Rhe02_14000 [Rhizocola hellebori]|uniref:Uncharacterized protein n=1 Tax=Rhizocola hellebori TaxID=1392758 RepID=A0A8J3Q3M6_9ACTN|nr:hypothetical protein [Rhizocola hellebori]GIH03333.1 hypothetical protein Rhe02_14000 [Rhizocola hellebori]
MISAETNFWQALEYRVTAELAGLADHSLRHHWCDGLIPADYDLAGDPPCIRGRAYCGRSGQEHWQFTLFVAPGTPARDRIDWPALLPAADLTGWLTVCPTDRTLTLNPLAAHALHSGQ